MNPDVIGKVVGTLTVIAAPENSEMLTCRCNCGHEGQYPKTLLRPSYRGPRKCPYCLGSPCVICGEIVPYRGRRMKLTCSDVCHTKRIQEKGRKYYRDVKDTDRFKAVLKRQRKAHRERMASDPEYAERHRARHQKILKRHRARINADPIRRHKRLKANREYYAKWIEKIRDNPTLYAEHLKKQREWYHSLSEEDRRRIFYKPKKKD